MKILLFIPFFYVFLCCVAALNPWRNDFQQEQATELNDFWQSGIMEDDTMSSAPGSDSITPRNLPRFESNKMKEEHSAGEGRPQLLGHINFAKAVLYGRQKRDTANDTKMAQSSETPRKTGKTSNRRLTSTESMRSA